MDYEDDESDDDENLSEAVVANESSAGGRALPTGNRSGSKSNSDSASGSASTRGKGNETGNGSKSVSLSSIGSGGIAAEEGSLEDREGGRKSTLAVTGGVGGAQRSSDLLKSNGSLGMGSEATAVARRGESQGNGGVTEGRRREDGRQGSSQENSSRPSSSSSSLSSLSSSSLSGKAMVEAGGDAGVKLAGRGVSKKGGDDRRSAEGGALISGPDTSNGRDREFGGRERGGGRDGICGAKVDTKTGADSDAITIGGSRRDGATAADPPPSSGEPDAKRVRLST